MKKFEQLTGMTVFPSKVETIEVIPTDGYNGAHRYRARMLNSFKNGRSNYSTTKTDTIQFVQHHEDDSWTPGWQDEQLLYILIDRAIKLNEKYPHPTNKKKLDGLYMALEACKERVEERMSRNVQGELKK